MKYRIVIKNKDKFYPQVKMKHFLFFNKWQRIGKHPDGGFGLYDNLSYSQPLRKSALEVIEEFDKWYSGREGFIEYENITI